MEGGAMDTLFRVTKDHRIISEMLLMYKELLENVSLKDVFTCAEDLDRLFWRTVRPHFLHEETQVFPYFLSQFPQIEKDIGILLNEHAQMTRKMQLINELYAGLKKHDDPAQKEQMFGLCRELSGELTAHALKEDAAVFALLK
jgi:hypothetical protein